MNIMIMHNSVEDNDSPDARDVLVQAGAVHESLSCLGHRASIFSCGLDLENVRKQILEQAPDLIFNLVEDLAGFGRLIHVFPFLLEALRIPYTGSSAQSLFLTSHKTMAKEVMRKVAIPTPEWTGPCPVSEHPGCLPRLQKSVDRWIIKSLWEHASLGLDAESIIAGKTPQDLFAEMEKRRSQLGGACFAEEYIDGREFNLSLLAKGIEPEVLPPAEIVFEDFPPEMARIVDYQAKWHEETFAYKKTIRRFDFDHNDNALLERLKNLAKECWQVFGLSGYARVDFRVDSLGNPYILEVNANPCLSPDAGFAAAARQAGLDFKQVVDRIINEPGII